MILILLAASSNLSAYSVLTHEAIIDSVWQTNIRTLLLQRFPDATPDQLRQAHAYVYGGAIVQDLGYYPHGSHFFTDLVHYVRSGDFVLALLRDSRDLNEYAFALGALAHYAADDDGHRLAVNTAVPLLYPDLGRKFGNVVTYEDNPVAHLKTEFGFDVLQVAKGRYAPDAYHDFIGFEVSKSLLERAFQDTYSMPLQSVFDNLDQAIGSYRYNVRSTIPKATKIAWVLKKNEIQKDLPGATKQTFLYNLSRASYRREWGKGYRGPSFGDKILAGLFWLLPKIGPLKALTLKMPTPQAESMFMASFNAALVDYKKLLDNQRAGTLALPNRNFDTGGAVEPGVYFMTDQTYARLLNDLANSQFRYVSAPLQADILAYYRDPNAPIVTKKNAKAWQQLSRELTQLKSATPSSALATQAN